MSKKLQSAIQTRVLHIKLNELERTARAIAATRLTSEVNKTKAEAKVTAEAFKQKIKPIERELSENVEACISGLEYREVECEQVFDTATGQTWWLYKGTEYARRRMSDAEMREATQRLFKSEPPLGDTPEKPKKSKADPGLLVHNVTPIGKAANSDLADVIREETSKGKKKDHSV